MPSSSARHYDTLLAEHYTWMSGGLEANVARNSAFFAQHGIAPKLGGVAVDLGAGSGYQTIPLARAGFRVYAVDLSERLLAEVRAAATGLEVITVRSDLVAFTRQVREPVELFVCMGDTLPHLERRDDVPDLFSACAEALLPGGKLVLTFRDLSTEREGLDRFIPVRSEADRIFTCFLEYAPQHVTVHDLVHVRQPDGTWALRTSAYRKLRLSEADVAALAGAAGLAVQHRDAADGLVTLIAAKA
jgi:SAM-dependent methyltransferase